MPHQEYHLVGPGQKLLLKAQNSTDTRDSICATPENNRSVMIMSNSSIPDITKRKTPDFQPERTRKSFLLETLMAQLVVENKGGYLARQSGR